MMRADVEGEGTMRADVGGGVMRAKWGAGTMRADVEGQGRWLGLGRQ